MRVTLLMDGRKIGYLVYEHTNPDSLLGHLGTIHAQPTVFAQEIQRRIKTNSDHIATRGGHMPDDLSRYWDGVYMVLLRIAEEYPGFQFQVPDNPLDDSELDAQAQKVY